MATRNLLIPTNPHTLLPNSMLKRLLFSSSKLTHFTPYSLLKFRPFLFLPSLSSVNPPIRILSMADKDQTFTTSSSGQNKHTNLLASEHSPYLLQHAHNPV